MEGCLIYRLGGGWKLAWGEGGREGEGVYTAQRRVGGYVSYGNPISQGQAFRVWLTLPYPKRHVRKVEVLGVNSMDCLIAAIADTKY